MTLDEIQAKLPPELRPWVRQYAPAFLAMSLDEVKAWIDLVIKGDVEVAYRAVLDKLDPAAVVAAGGDLVAGWSDLADKNAEKMNLQKQAFYGLLEIMLKIAFAAVGLRLP